MKEPIIVWLRNDLRIHDNPALYHASEQGPVLPVYILDDQNPGPYFPGAASLCHLHESLKSLIKSFSGKFVLRRGSPLEVLQELCKTFQAKAVYWNRLYEPWQIQRDSVIKKSLANLEVKSFNGSLLWEPHTILKADKSPYKVFTPYYKKGCLQAKSPEKALPKPKNLELVDVQAAPLSSLKLLKDAAWEEKIKGSAGEAAAKERLQVFLNKGLKDYKEGRNFPAKDCVSKLSAALHFGEISAKEIWNAVEENYFECEKDAEHFLSELGWREFSHYLLYHFPSLPEKNFQEKFDQFAWQENPELLDAWKQGLTGYPFVDAAMRELWQTGHMHNRMRMVAGSFLVKNLLIHWKAGERWFWDCLKDADLANNSAGWQWIAGSGADAAPYFRIFNPITQGQKFDPDGSYTLKYVPELEGIEEKYLFCPWQSPNFASFNYPPPIVDLAKSRDRALDAFSRL